MPTRGRFVCHVHCLVHDGAVRSSPCRPHHENFGQNLYHMFVPAYSASQSFVLFYLWYLSCFEVKYWIHTFPKRCSHISMWLLILLDHRVCHVNPFQPVCFSSTGSDHFNIRKTNYQFFSTVFASSVPSCLCFPTPTLFLQGLRFLIQLSILLMGSLSILFRQCSYPVISHEDAQQFQVHHSSFSYSFPLDLTQAFGVDHIPFLVSNAIPCWCIS